VPADPALAEKAHAPSQFKMARLMRDLEDLLLLKSAKPYHKLWQELKLKMSKSLEMTCVTADNAYVAELNNAVKALVNKQKQQTAAPTGAALYTAALHFGAAAAATGSTLVHKVLMHLT